VTKASITNKNCLAKNIQKYKHYTKRYEQLVRQFNHYYNVKNSRDQLNILFISDAYAQTTRGELK